MPWGVKSVFYCPNGVWLCLILLKKISGIALLRMLIWMLFLPQFEQHDCVELQGKPIGVVNGRVGTTVITASYEARKFGIKTGMHVSRAKDLCPDFIPVSSRPNRYAEVSTNFLSALQQLTDEIEIFSVDEAFLDFTHCRYLYRSPKVIAERIQQVVFEVVGFALFSGHCW